MKRWIPLVCLFALHTVNAAELSPNKAQSNQLATKSLYTQLMSGRTADAAGLNLFANMLPKGGDLHHHFSGAMYAETYLDWVQQKGFCVYKVSDADLQVEKFRVETNPPSLSAAKRNLCISAQDVRKDNPFYRNLLSAWSSKDYANHYHGETAPDEHFFDTFKYFENVASQGYQEGLQILKKRAKEENVSYLETLLSAGPAVNKPELQDVFKPLAKNASDAEIDEVLLRAYQLLANDADTSAAVDAYVKSVESASSGIDDDQFRLRFLSYASRNSAPEKVFGHLYTSFAAAHRSQKIVGVNIVGPENGYISMRDYALHMKMFELLGKKFSDVKRSLHAGELVLGMVPPEGLRFHIDQAVKVAGAHRIGHGVDIVHEANATELLKFMAQKKIAVEVNLTSNQDILGVTGSMHPMSVYKRFNVPMVIATDDPGVSRNNLSGEYLLFMTRYQPTYDELKKTVYNSIQFSFLSDAEKRAEAKKLDARFAEFEARMATLAKQKK